MSLYATYPHLHVPAHTNSSTNRASSSSSTTATNTRLNAASGSGPSPADSTTSLGLGAKLRDMFDMQKYAVFDVDITIHELGNVPQLQGKFCAEWHIKGKKPRAKDFSASSRHTPSAKPSLPNLKLTAADRDAKSISSVSLRSTSTGGSSTTSGTTAHSQVMKGKSMSTPPLAFGHGHSHGMPSGIHRTVDKKGSDPTPLRNSLRLDQEDENGLEIVESPTSAATGLTIPETSHRADGEGDETPGKSTLASTAMTGGHGLDSSSSSMLPPSTIASTPSASSSTSYLPVPMPKSGTPSQATTMERSASGQTNSGQSTKSGTKEGDRSDFRSRSNSTTNTGPSHPMPRLKRSSRSGTTPYRPLKSHTCTWDERLHLTLRLPISKDADRTESGTKSKAPFLGEGPESQSGIHLKFHQLLSPNLKHQPIDNESSTSVRNTSSGPEDAEGKREPIFRHGPRTKSVPIGAVDIDLAPFATRGRQTRKYLLEGGSKNNSTVQISVELFWVGGDRNWVAPPLTEGHHVGGRIKDVVGRDPSENLQKDLQLMQTPSHSSSGSSMNNAQSIISANPSNHVSSSHYQYKSYEHHLLSPDDAKLRTPASAGRQPEDSHRTPTTDDRTPNTPSTGTATTTGRGDDETDASNSPQTPKSTPRSAMAFWTNHRPHRYRHHHHHQIRNRLDQAGATKKTHGITEMDANAIIDSILNPHPGREDGPFTYVPIVPEPEPEPEVELRGEAEHYEQLPDEIPSNSRPKLGWRRRKTERKDTVSSVINIGRVVSSTGQAAGAGASRGTSPVRMPRSGSSNAIHA